MTDKLERNYFVAAGHGTHVAIDTTALCDRRLSWKAKALHYFIRTQMEALNNQQELVEAGPDGRDAVATGVKELLHYKYLYMQQHRDENGQFICALYTSFPEPVHITDEQLSTLLSTGSVPMSPENVHMSAPDTENPETVQNGQDVIYYLTTLNKTLINKSLRDLSQNSAATSVADQPTEYAQQKIIKEILYLWNELAALPTHKLNIKYKKYRSCLRVLKYALRTHEPEIIKGAIKEYNNLLDNKHTVLGTKAPARVGLDEFFAFNSYTQTVLDKFKKGAPMYGLTSWFNECKHGSAYLLGKYKDLRTNIHPEVARILEVELEMNTGWRPPPDNKQDANTFRLAANMVVEYLKKYHKNLPHAYTPADLACDLINMVCNFNDPHPGMLTNERTWEAFDRYLIDLAIMEQYEREAHHGFAATASI